jgi:hypothetical protein
MRDRLIEILEDDYDFSDFTGQVDYEALADHLLKNGVIVPRLKVGDRVFSKPYRYTLTGDAITQIKINRGGIHYKCWWGYFHQSDIGKTVFLTKEEAEAKLKELQNHDGI